MMPYVEQCEGVLPHPIVNDHIAFRSFGGIHELSCIFEALGYEAKGCYTFPNKHLTAIHYEHCDNKDFPKLFISELKIFELEGEARQIIMDALVAQRPVLSTELLSQLYKDPSSDLMSVLLDYFETLPWKLPTRQEVETLNQHSQYAAWVLVHGYRVNHFTALISHPDSLDAAYKRFQDVGIPMKDTIEGEVGSKLRQTSTTAVLSKVHVMGEGGVHDVMEWPYAYMEFAERNVIQVDGHPQRFEGFLGAQATELFEMTKTVNQQ